MDDVNLAFENYLDDIIGIDIDTPQNRNALKHAVTLALSVIFRPIKNEKIPRDDFVNMKKHAAEGCIEEAKTILGWFIDFRSFKIHLPTHKLKEWTSDINEIIRKRGCSTKSLHTTIGRLNHAGYILPFGRYFLNRLRKKLAFAEKKDLKFINLNQAEIDDLKLWKNCYSKQTLTA